MSEFDYFCVEVDIVFLVKYLILCFRFPKISEERFLLKVSLLMSNQFSNKRSHTCTVKTQTLVKQNIFQDLKEKIIFGNEMF